VFSPDKVVERLIILAGGPDKLRQSMDARLREFNEAWHRDTDAMGRLLRAHLVVEHFMGKYLAFVNPRLASLENARLSYLQKLELLTDDSVPLQVIRPGLKRLNELRNKFAHRLNHRLTWEDVEDIATLPVFKAFREELAKPGVPSNRPIEIVDEFARLASTWLQSGSNEEGTLWERAMAED